MVRRDGEGRRHQIQYPSDHDVEGRSSDIGLSYQTADSAEDQSQQSPEQRC